MSKAEEYLEKHLIGAGNIPPQCHAYYAGDASEAVDIADKEMKEKAIECHKRCCSFYDFYCNGYGARILCEGDCQYMTDFTEMLNK